MILLIATLTPTMTKGTEPQWRGLGSEGQRWLRRSGGHVEHSNPPRQSPRCGWKRILFRHRRRHNLCGGSGGAGHQLESGWNWILDRTPRRCCLCVEQRLCRGGGGWEQRQQYGILSGCIPQCCSRRRYNHRRCAGIIFQLRELYRHRSTWGWNWNDRAWRGTRFNIRHFLLQPYGLGRGGATSLPEPKSHKHSGYFHADPVI